LERRKRRKGVEGGTGEKIAVNDIGAISLRRRRGLLGSLGIVRDSTAKKKPKKKRADKESQAGEGSVYTLYDMTGPYENLKFRAQRKTKERERKVRKS